MVGVFERVYETGPVFRAEPHDTVRHLAEYVSLDVELGFIRGRHGGNGRGAGVRGGALLGLDLPQVPVAIPRIHFHAEQRMLETASGEDLGGEFAPAQERWLGEWARTAHGPTSCSSSGTGHGWPAPASLRRLPGGGRRTAREALAGYLEAFRHGMPPHGGFAIGLERWTARLVEVPNIRQATLFPRDLNRLKR